MALPELETVKDLDLLDDTRTYYPRAWPLTGFVILTGPAWNRFADFCDVSLTLLT